MRMNRRNYITQECAWPGCGRSYYATIELAPEVFSSKGTSTIKQTKYGMWSCEGHSFAVGGGWIG